MALSLHCRYHALTHKPVQGWTAYNHKCHLLSGRQNGCESNGQILSSPGGRSAGACPGNPEPHSTPGAGSRRSQIWSRASDCASRPAVRVGDPAPDHTCLGSQTAHPCPRPASEKALTGSEGRSETKSCQTAPGRATCLRAIRSCESAWHTLWRQQHLGFAES